jgi:hypothetical protein
MERRDPSYLGNMTAQFLDTIDRVCEYAIRLVHLGADCQVKLQIPAQRRKRVGQHRFVGVYQIHNFGGKTAQELASTSRRRELIRAIEIMQKTENVHLTQCRCGSTSRLCWLYYVYYCSIV